MQSNVSSTSILQDGSSTLSPNIEKAIIGIIAAVLLLSLGTIVTVTVVQMRRSNRRRRSRRNDGGYLKPLPGESVELGERFREHTAAIEARLKRTVRRSVAATVSSRHHREESGDTMAPLMTTDAGRGLPSLMTSLSELSLPSMFAVVSGRPCMTVIKVLSGIVLSLRTEKMCTRQRPSRLICTIQL